MKMEMANTDAEAAAPSTSASIGGHGVIDSSGCTYSGSKFCRHEFNAIFFGRRDSHRYRLADNRGIGTASYDPYKSHQQEKEERVARQLRLQLAVGGLVVLIFIVTLSVVISMLLSGEEPPEFISLEPRSPQGGNVVWLDRDNPDDLAALLARINGAMDEYDIRRWYPRLAKAGRRAADCEGEARYPSPDREICVPRLHAFGSCHAYSAFGYMVGDPCVLLKAGPALTGNYSENLLLSCRAAVDADGAKLELRFYPQLTYLGQNYAYFPRYFFPYQPESSFYLPPLAMAQILKPPKGRSFHVNCSLANAAFANVSARASVQMLFL